MIKRTLICTAAFLVAYSLLLAIPGARSCFSIQSLWQDNLIRFQEFTVATPRPECVIIGTSLVRGIDAKSVAASSYNLAATGGNVLTGLEVVAHQPSLPKILFVETTMIMQDGAEGVADNALRPVFAQLRPWLPMLRERYQPANLLGWAIGERALRSVLQLCHVPTQSPNPAEATRNETRFAEARTREVAARQTLHDPKKLASRAAELKKHIDALTQRGVRIVLIEMPHDSLVMDTPRVHQVHDVLTTTFPENSYTWIRPTANHRYETTDAIHLAAPELTGYNEKMRQAVAAAKYAGSD